MAPNGAMSRNVAPDLRWGARQRHPEQSVPKGSEANPFALTATYAPPHGGLAAVLCSMTYAHNDPGALYLGTPRACGAHLESRGCRPRVLCAPSRAPTQACVGARDLREDVLPS